MSASSSDVCLLKVLIVGESSARNCLNYFCSLFKARLDFQSLNFLPSFEFGLCFAMQLMVSQTTTGSKTNKMQMAIRAEIPADVPSSDCASVTALVSF